MSVSLYHSLGFNGLPGRSTPTFTFTKHKYNHTFPFFLSKFWGYNSLSVYPIPSHHLYPYPHVLYLYVNIVHRASSSSSHRLDTTSTCQSLESVVLSSLSCVYSLHLLYLGHVPTDLCILSIHRPLWQNNFHRIKLRTTYDMYSSIVLCEIFVFGNFLAGSKRCQRQQEAQKLNFSQFWYFRDGSFTVHLADFFFNSPVNSCSPCIRNWWKLKLNWNESWIGIGYREQPYFL